ncbi:podocalyxin-like [Manihot esculenta]|uniref:podocalyxin-like n=1 Tax=Manihot esculenta TaxID=3983 RepID=UPI000B5D91AA|nr:podocalyxin-like [Manihot esculenta]
MNTASGAFRVGQPRGETSQQVAEVGSFKSSFRPPSPTPVRAPKPDPRDDKSSRSSSCSRPGSTTQAVQAPRSPQTSRSSENAWLMGTKSALPSGDALGRGLGTSATEVKVLVNETKIAPVGNVQGAPVEGVQVTEGRESGSADGECVAEEVGDKRPAPTEVPAPVPIPKESWASRRPAPVLPPLEKKKNAPVVSLMPASDSNLGNNMISEVYCRIQDAAHIYNIRQIMVDSCQDFLVENSEDDQFVVDFDVERLCYEKQRSAAPSQASVDASRCVFRDVQSSAHKYASRDNALMAIMLYRPSCAALSKQKSDNATEFAKCHIPSVVVEGSLLSGWNLLLRVLGGMSQRVLGLSQSVMSALLASCRPSSDDSVFGYALAGFFVA